MASTDDTQAANRATIVANIEANAASIEAWITANPSGAVLTAAQTLFVAKTLVAAYRLVVNDVLSTGGT